MTKSKPQEQYCLCKGPEKGFMICCDTCEEWFHGECVGITRKLAESIDKYSCPLCVRVDNVPNNKEKREYADEPQAHPLPQPATGEPTPVSPVTPPPQLSPVSSSTVTGTRRSSRPVKHKKWDFEGFVFEELPFMAKFKDDAVLAETFGEEGFEKVEEGKVNAAPVKALPLSQNKKAEKEQKNCAGEEKSVTIGSSKTKELSVQEERAEHAKPKATTQAKEGKEKPDEALRRFLTSSSGSLKEPSHKDKEKEKDRNTPIKESSKQKSQDAGVKPSPPHNKEPPKPSPGKEVIISTPAVPTNPALCAIEMEENTRRTMKSKLTEALTLTASEAGLGPFHLDPDAVAVQIEDELYRLYNRSNGKSKEYALKCRSLVFNLKDPKNPGLRGRILSGELTPAKFVSMRPEEYANTELTEYRKAVETKSLASIAIRADDDDDSLVKWKKTHKGEVLVDDSLVVPPKKEE